MPRYSSITELPLVISQDGALPAQIAEQLRALILAGTLAPADSLPSTRALAERLGISRGSVVAAFEQLSAEGYVQTSKGGTRVTENLKLQKTAERQKQTRAGRAQKKEPAAVIDLSPGTPDTSLLTTSAWRAAWRVAAAEPGGAYPAAGSARLQNQLAEHLRIMRHVVREPANILVTAGARDGFRLLLTGIRQEHRNRPLRIAVENPGYPSLHRIPATFGHTIVPVEVDAHGLNPSLLAGGKESPDLVLVAPSHQYPLGASMPVARRLELIEWARAHHAYIVEDDYDSELRYTGDPLPALAALDRVEDGRVITLGSFTKTLTPGLGMGYLLAPHSLRKNLTELRQDLGTPVSSIVQDAMAAFLAGGGARRHIARMRRVYGSRRELLLNILGQLPPWVEVLPMDGGLHVVLRLHGIYATESIEAQLTSSLLKAGVMVGALGEYWSSTGQAQQGRDFGMIVGFAGVNERSLLAGANILVQRVREHTLALG